MKVLINSDIIYHDQLILDKISKSLQMLFSSCHEKGHTVIIPLTTLYEFNKQQAELVTKEISTLEGAFRLLDKYGIRHSNTEPQKLLKLPNLLGLIKQYDANATVEEPTFEDFKEAHKRACLHQHPHPPNIKSDEMRDMVIWVMALRFASQDGGAMLISRDEVHVHERGDEEAQKAKLIRAKSVEEALDIFYIETPTGRLVKGLLEPIWAHLVDVGLPLTPKFSLLGISGARFIQGIDGLSLASFSFKARTPGGKIFQALIRIDVASGIITKATLSETKVGEEIWEEKTLPLVISSHEEFIHEKDDFNERVNALKELLEE